MTYQMAREEFTARMARAGVTDEAIRLVLRHANTIQRLAVAECNGDDWRTGNLVRCPNAGNQRAGKWCPGCSAQGEGDGHEKVTASSVRSAHAEKRIAAIVAPFGFVPDFQGDPRGNCTRLHMAGEKGEGSAIHVPTRRY